MNELVTKFNHLSLPLLSEYVTDSRRFFHLWFPFLGWSLNEQLVGESERLRMKKLEELSKSIESMR